MTNNAKLVNPPINPADLKTQVATYASLIAAAADGGKKAITERKNQRAVVVKMLRQLGSKRTVMTMQRSFRTSPQPLAGPPSFKVDNGPNSGQVIMRGKRVPKAVTYMARYAPMGSDGKPGSWTEMDPVTVIRSITVTGLTPGDLRISDPCPGPDGLYGLERLRNPHLDVVR